MANISNFFHTSKITSVTWDNTEKKLTLTFPYQENVLPEKIIADLIIAIERAAQNKLNNINSPISEKPMADTPKAEIYERTSADNSVREMQIQYKPQIVLWLKMVDIDELIPVNDQD